MPSRLASLLLLTLAVTGTALHAAALKLPVVDDAAISIAYGQSFFAGRGFRLTELSPAVEGFSNPLWTVLVGMPLPVEPLALAKWLDILFGSAALVFASLAIPEASGRPLRPSDTFGAWLVACLPNYGYWLCSGMESGLHAFLLAFSTWSLVRDFRLGRGGTSGVALALFALTRPEAPLFIAGAGAIWSLWLWRAKRWPGRPELILISSLLAICLAYLAFRWSYFARLLPNTYYAKLQWDFDGGKYLKDFLSAHLWVVVLTALLLVPALSRSDTRRPTVLALSFIALTLFFAHHVKGDWMQEWRFLAPTWPLFALILSAGTSALTDWRPLVGHLTTLPLLAAAITQYPRVAQVSSTPGFPAAFVMDQARTLRAGLTQLGITTARVALPDVGGAGMLLRKDRIVDVAGLADYAIATHAGNHAALEDYLISEGLPEVVDAHGPSGHLATYRKLLEHYRRDGQFWILKGLGPGSDPRCPLGYSAEALRQAVRQQQPEAAIAQVRCLQAHSQTVDPSSIDEAFGASVTADTQGHAKAALRWASLATILSNEDAHLRRRTEKLRLRFLSSPESSPSR